MAEEQREQNQGFFSRVIDGANSGYNNYRNARMAANAGKQLGKQIGKKAVMQGGRVVVTEGAVALFSNPAGWVILGIGLVLVIVVVILFGGVSGVKGGDLTNSPSPSPTESSSPGPTTQPGGPDKTEILVWGRKINNVLTKALGCSNTIYNRQQSIIRNTAGYSAAIRGGDCQGYGGAYLCTRLVKDAYNLAGIKNNLSEWTPSMVSQWGSIRGLTLLKTNNVRMVKPGDAVFWYGLSGSCNCYRYRHADLIDAISVNSSGNGVLYTIDANVNQKLIKHYVSGWKLLGNVWLPAATNVAFGLGPR